MKLINQNPAEDMIHLATLHQSNTDSLDELRSLLESNVYFLINILENYLSNKDVKIINVCSYMQLLDQSLQNAYSLSKEMVKIFLEKNKYRVKNIYLFDTFGKGDTRNKVTDVFIRHALNKEKFIIPENDIEINLTAVEDVTRSLIKSLELKSGNYSIFSSNTLKLKELALIIGKLLDFQVEIVRQGLGVNNFPGSLQIPPNILEEKSELKIEKKIIERINELKKA
jgi:nucleoside-diphosphate-sugar epimerase